MTDITVITATIPGREAMLAEAVRSVERQTVPCDHIIFRDENLQGIQHAMNTLWPQVQTPWMQWLADDDLLLPHHLEMLQPFMKDADIIHSYCIVEGRPGWVPNYSAEESDYWMPATALMRTSFVQGVGGWDPHAYPEDHAFWLKARDRGARFAVNRMPTWIYRFHDTNLTFTKTS